MIEDIKDYLDYLEPYQRWAFYISSGIVGLVFISLLIAFPAVVVGILITVVIVLAIVIFFAFVMGFIYDKL